MTRADGVRRTRSLFQAGDGGSRPTSALQLWLDVIDFPEARRLNRLWHSTLPRLGTGSVKNPEDRFLCYGAEFAGLWYAVGIWSLPAARALPQDGSWLELRRLAVSPDAPRNTPSRMLRVMTLLIRRARPGVVTLCSSHDTETHTGAIYRAAGWVKKGGLRRGRAEWDCPSRPRPKAQSDAPKQRWEKVLRGDGEDSGGQA